MLRRRQASIGDALNSTMRGVAGGPRIRESLVYAYWEDVVGSQAASASEPESIRDGILFVRTKSSVWSQELTFHKSHIMGELNRRIGANTVKDIVYRAKGITRKQTVQAEEEAPAFPTAEELNLVRLTADDRAMLERDIAQAEQITDPAIRASIERRLTRDRKIRRWRLEHGWRQCARCTALHRVEGSLCPVCRLGG